MKFRPFRILCSLGAIFFAVTCSYASTTYYVRTDGGTSAQCTGLADAAYPGSGIALPCAFNHPFWALPPGRPPVMQGGDTLIISGGSYMMGSGAPNGVRGSSGPADVCNPSWTYECVAPAIPSGPDPEHPTKILGKAWDTKSSPAPELWGTERAKWVLDLTRSNNVEISYIEITDHSSCIYNSPDPAKACNRSIKPYGPHADIGIRAVDSTNVILKDVNIHGLSKNGIWAGRLTDWTFDAVTIRGNGAGAGWNADVGEGTFESGSDSSNRGTITLKNSKIEYSGCGEQYPSKNIYGCMGQGQNGAGDGIGAYETGANWILENSEISHNTQDGLDLLYHVGPSKGSITIRNSRFEGNAGNQIKVSTNTKIENSIIIGNCDYFYNNPLSENYNNTTPDFCRASGEAILVNGWGTVSNRKPYFQPGTNYIAITNSLVTSTGLDLIGTKGTSCDGTEKIVLRNNIMFGMENWYQKTHGGTGSKAIFIYSGGSDGNGTGPCGTMIHVDHRDSINYNLTVSACPNSNNVLCVDPALAAIPPLSGANDMWTYGDRWDVTPRPSSPTIGKNSTLPGRVAFGDITIPSRDIVGAQRGTGSITWGPYEKSVAAPPAPPSGIQGKRGGGI